jgi:hypothetical protein
MMVPASAHHSSAMYDMQNQLALSGTVKDFQFTNPHCWIQLLVGAQPSREEWSIQMGAPVHLIRSGWKPTTLKPGDAVTVILHPMRNGSRGGVFVSMTTSDGKPVGVAQ